jgi:succinyl-CoA:(S)-malate CoA-transferase subunit B
VTPGSATLPDYMSGLFGAFGVLLALRARERTGEGQMIDIGLYESIFRVLDELAPRYDLDGFVRQRMGPGTVNTVPHSHYPTRDERWVAIACTSDKIFERLARLMGAAELAGAGRFGTTAQRQAAREEVDAMVTAWTRRHDRDRLLSLCEEAQVPCGPVYAIDEIFADPQYAARGNLLAVDDPRLGRALRFANVFPRLSATPGRLDHLGEALGGHTEDIYRVLLGLTASDLAALKEKGVV